MYEGSNIDERDDNGGASKTDYDLLQGIPYGSVVVTRGTHRFKGDTILHCACLYGHMEFAKLLIIEGANLRVKNGADLSPLDIYGKGCSSDLSDFQTLTMTSTLERLFVRESNWKRRKAFAEFLSSIKNISEENKSNKVGMKTRSQTRSEQREQNNARVSELIDMIFCRRDICGNIAAFL